MFGSTLSTVCVHLRYVIIILLWSNIGPYPQFANGLHICTLKLIQKCCFVAKMCGCMVMNSETSNFITCPNYRH